MSVTVRIPTILRRWTHSQAVVQAEGPTLSALVENLEVQYPGLKERLIDDSGHLRRFVNLFVNDEIVSFQESLETPLSDDDEVSIVPAIAGG